MNFSNTAPGLGCSVTDGSQKPPTQAPAPLWLNTTSTRVSILLHFGPVHLTLGWRDKDHPYPLLPPLWGWRWVGKVRGFMVCWQGSLNFWHPCAQINSAL